MIYSQHLNVSVQSARGTALVVIESSIFVLVNLAALVGNLVVCLVFYRSPSLRTVTNYFVISLALTDLLMSVLVMPLVVTSSIANEWITGQLGCKLMQVCGNALAGISVLTIMLLAVNRYFCVVRPTLYIYVFSKKRSIAMAVSVWIATIFAVLVQFVFTGMRFRTFTFQPTICFRDFPSTSSSIAYSTIQILYIVIPSSIIVACYWKIYQTVRRHNTVAAPSSQKKYSAYGVAEKKITRILTTVLVVFYLCWLPVVVTKVLEAFDIVEKTGGRYYNFHHTFPLFLSSVTNPIIYVKMSQPFRKEFLNTFCGS